MSATVPLSQGLVAVVDDEDYERVIRAGKWSAARGRSTFYARRKARQANGQRTSLRLHNFLTGWPLVDHINGDGLDNRRANLREATNAQNMRNKGLYRNNSSGFKGVSWQKECRKWQAGIRLDGTRRHLGLFLVAEDAAAAYDEAARELHGEFARLNFPGLGELGIEAP